MWRSHLFSRSLLASGIIHIVGVVAAHSYLTAYAPDFWPARSGICSVELTGSIEISASNETLLPVEVSESRDEIAETGNETELVPSEGLVPRRVVEDEMLASLPVTRIDPAFHSDELRFDVVRATLIETSEDRGACPNHSTKRATPPPSISSLAAIESVFSAGELRKTIPQPYYNPAPNFPPELLAARQSGIVLLCITVSETGQVTACTVQRSSGHSSFDDAALQTITKWRFQPAIRFGIPVATKVLCPIRFQFLES
jgi:protein TonB